MTEAERAIREALPFATPGRWEHVFFNGGREHYVYAPDAHYRRDLPGPVKVAWLPYSPGSNRDANNAVYIAACNPENIAALLAEIDRLTRERDEARAERDAMAKDAERYRFLRTRHVVETMNDGELCIHYACDFEHYNDPDASIDAALAAKEK